MNEEFDAIRSAAMLRAVAVMVGCDLAAIIAIVAAVVSGIWWLYAVGALLLGFGAVYFVRTIVALRRTLEEFVMGRPPESPIDFH